MVPDPKMGRSKTILERHSNLALVDLLSEERQPEEIPDEQESGQELPEVTINESSEGTQMNRHPTMQLDSEFTLMERISKRKNELEMEQSSVGTHVRKLGTAEMVDGENREERIVQLEEVDEISEELGTGTVANANPGHVQKVEGWQHSKMGSMRLHGDDI